MKIDLTFEELKQLFSQSSHLPDKKEPVPDIKPEELVKTVSPLDEITAEEMLYFATPYYDELQAKKEAHLKKLKEEG